MTCPSRHLARRNTTTLGTLRDRYLAAHSNGTIEQNSLGTARLHFWHFCRSLGGRFPLAELSALRLQEYLGTRTRKGISPVTLRKELATVRAAWNWGGLMGLTGGPFPGKGLRYPKGKDKPLFMLQARRMRGVSPRTRYRVPRPRPDVPRCAP